MVYFNAISELLKFEDANALTPTMEFYMNYSKTYDNSRAKPMEVYRCDYPFLSLGHDKGKQRRCIVIEDKLGNLWAMNVSSYDTTNKDKVNRASKSYSVLINIDYISQGFTTKVFAQGPVLLPINIVKLHGEPTGTVNQSTYNKCINAIKEAENLKFKDTFALLNWLKKIKVSPRNEDYNTAKIQNIFDIDISRKANMVDIISCAYNILLYNHEEYSNPNIFRVNLIDKLTKNNLSIFSLIYTDKYLPATRCFRFLPSNPPLGDDIISTSKNLNRIINSEIHSWILPFYHKETGSYAKYQAKLLTDEQLNVWLHCMTYRKTVKELLDALNSATKVTKIPVHNVFVTK